jgi:uncharacterized membrane protein YraQ (UPF0718 family)
VRNDTLLTNMDDSSPQQPGPHSGWQANRVWLLLGVLAVVWWIIWDNLERTANWLTFDVIGLAPGTALGDALAFFLYDVPKILLLLTGMIFLVSTLRTFFSVERTRQLLGGKRQGVGNVLAALLGVVTPFCSCSAVPLFIGFVEAGIPLGVTFSFLIAAPMINEIAVVMLFGLFGWQVAALYMGTGLLIAIVAGVIIGRVPNVEHGVEDFVWKISVGSSGMEAGDRMNWSERFAIAWQTTREIVGKVWLFVIAGIAVGAFIHGFHGQRCVVECARRRRHRRAHVFQRRGHHPGDAGVDGQRCIAGHSAGLHDECGGVEPARNDYPAPGAQAPSDCGFRRRGLAGHCAYWLSL